MKRLIAICLALFTLCSCSNEPFLNFSLVFETAYESQNYDALYSLLSEESKTELTREDFISKFEQIHTTMGAKNIQIEMLEQVVDEPYIPFSLSVDTLAGPVYFSDYKLYYTQEKGELKVIFNDALIFPMMSKSDSIHVKEIAPVRGNIFDRFNEPLAYTGTINMIGIHPAMFSRVDITPLANALDISEDYIKNKLDAASNPDHFVLIVDILPEAKAMHLVKDLDLNGVIIDEKVGRIYKNHEAFGRLVGYVDAITEEELQKYEELGYDNTSLIGKSGLEQVYEQTLRGRAGCEIYLKRDDEPYLTLASLEAIDGEDIYLTIDSSLQTLIYDRLNRQKASATAVDPVTGEILALVSSPSFNSNDYATYRTKTVADYRERIQYTDNTNRFTALYSPGSTFKLITAATALKTETFKPDEVKQINKMSWQPDTSWGGYFINRINSHQFVSLEEAIKYSDNIYFAKTALDLGVETLQNGATAFAIGETLDIGYPLPRSQLSNENQIETDILLADTGYGQGEILVSTLNVALAYSALSNDGHIMKPTLIVDDFTPTILREHAIAQEDLQLLQSLFTKVIADSDGTGHLAFNENHTLAGKTGTAEIKSTQGLTGIENGWFVATDLNQSRISLAVVVEEVQEELGTLGVVKLVGEMLKAYLQ